MDDPQHAAGAGFVVTQLLVVLGASLGAVFLLGRVKLPSIVGFLVTGIAIGPNALGLVREEHLIETLAEIGVVLLMFTIGLKFSLAELSKMRGFVFGAGALQVLLTIAACVGLGLLTGLPLAEGVFLGFLVAMSSTAIVLKLFEEHAQTESPHGRLATGILIFQDLAVVPLILVTPMLAGRGGSTGAALLELGKSLGLVAVIVVVAKLMLPRVFALAVGTRSREVFTLTTALVILATAAAAGVAGLSLALGALIAGVVLSESDYAQQVLSDMVPLRDLLTSLFFVSIGMLVDVRGWAAEPALVAGLTAGILLLKGVLVFSIARWFRLGTRIAALAGLAVGQVGEFSFVLASEGRKLDLVPAAHYQTFLSVSVLTMALTPFLFMLGPWLAGKTGGRAASGAEHDTRKGHAIVVGYGVAGRNVAAVLRQMNVPPLVLELNPRTIRQIREAGGEASFGDAGREEVLQHAGIAGARAIVLTALDPVATRQSIATIRRLNARIEVIVRTRFVVEIGELRRLGATAVVPEEFESSIALAALTMERFGATPDAVARYERALRGRGDYSLLREDAPEATRDATVAGILRAAAFDEVAVTAASAGKTLRALSLRARTGALVIGVRRGDEFLPAPGPDDALTPGDALIVVARPHEAEAARHVL